MVQRKNSMDKIAVVLATYNGEKYLREQLDSIQRQTYPEIEVYIHDDGSTDGTLEIINEYVKNKQSKVKFSFVGQSTLRYPQCFISTLLSIPRADYYAFCDQDDVWFEDKIEKAVKAMKRFGNECKASLFYSAVDYYDSNLNYIRNARFVNRSLPLVGAYSLQSMLLGGEAMGMTFLFNNKVRDLMKRVSENGKFDFKDTFIKIYCAACGIVIYSSKPCAKYRRHSAATTLKMNPAGKIQRAINMAKKIFLEKDGLESIQASVDYVLKEHHDEIEEKNKAIINAFASPNSIIKKLKKVFWPKRFRLRLIDELGYRVAFLMGRI